MYIPGVKRPPYISDKTDFQRWEADVLQFYHLVSDYKS